jgi:hypothetical protein
MIVEDNFHFILRQEDCKYLDKRDFDVSKDMQSLNF